MPRLAVDRALAALAPHRRRRRRRRQCRLCLSLAVCPALQYLAHVRGGRARRGIAAGLWDEGGSTPPVQEDRCGDASLPHYRDGQRKTVKSCHCGQCHDRHYHHRHHRHHRHQKKKPLLQQQQQAAALPR